MFTREKWECFNALEYYIKQQGIDLDKFTDDDIEKLQQIADTKGNLGLDKAILKAYAPSRASPLSINQKVNRLTVQLKGLSQKVTDLTQQEQVLAIRIEQLRKQIEVLEKSKRKKLFGK